MRISDWSSDVCSSDLIALIDVEDLIVITQRGGIVARLDVERGDLEQRDGLRAAIVDRTIDFERLVIIGKRRRHVGNGRMHAAARSEEHTSELQSLMRISYAVFCLQNKNTTPHIKCH